MREGAGDRALALSVEARNGIGLFADGLLLRSPDDPPMTGVVGALIDLDGRPHYLHSGWFLISVANLVVIVAMIVVFVLAIFVPFPRDKSEPEQ